MAATSKSSKSTARLNGNGSTSVLASSPSVMTTPITEDILHLAATLHREDLEELRRHQHEKGKRREDAPPTDEEVAFDLFADELDAFFLQEADLQFARSIQRACVIDEPILRELQEQEQVARRDRELAMRMSGNARRVFTRPNRNVVSSQPSSSVSASPEASSSKGMVGAHSNSISASSKTPVAPQEERLCVACYDVVSDSAFCLAQCPDQHIYHDYCVVNLVQASLKDESLMPPSCCQTPFNEDQFLAKLNDEDKNTFRCKREEFGTKNRLYCSNAPCSAFLGSAEEGMKAAKTCEACGKQTCMSCKAPWHGKSNICANVSEEEAIGSFKILGMQRCPDCGHVVELMDGCNHMTCICKAQFCYLCAKRWKTCKCAQWSEDRLRARAAENVRRQARGGYLAPLDEEELEREVAALRNNHECAHRGDWVRVPGRLQCDRCHDLLFLYLNQCTECQGRFCTRCRLNRL